MLMHGVDGIGQDGTYVTMVLTIIHAGLILEQQDLVVTLQEFAPADVVVDLGVDMVQLYGNIAEAKERQNHLQTAQLNN